MAKSEEQQKKTLPATLVIDTLTSMGERAMNYALTLDPKKGLGGAPAQQHYLPEIWNIKEVLQRGRMFDGHFVCIAHERYEKDGLTEAITTVPSMDGRYAFHMSKDFDEYYRMTVKNTSDGAEFQWQTQPRGAYNARTTRGWDPVKEKNRFNPYEEADYRKLLKKAPNLANGRTRWLIQGPAGSGKTVSVLKTFPKPIIVLDFDDRDMDWDEVEGIYVVQFNDDRLKNTARDFMTAKKLVDKIVSGAFIEDLFEQEEEAA